MGRCQAAELGKDFKEVKFAIDVLEDRISAAMAAATARDDCAAIVRPSTDPKFGDYQANGVMAVANELKS